MRPILFKHALVQDAAYGTLLRGPRRTLHAKIAETLESQFGEVARSQPELLARHFTEAGQVDRAAEFWGKAGLRSLERSALVEAVEQLSRALDQISELPATPALRREQIGLRVALLTPLMAVKGFAAAETKAAAERAQALIEQAESLGEAPDDRLLLFSVLFGFWTANYVAGDASAAFELAGRFLSKAEETNSTVPLMVGHRLMGSSLFCIGDFPESMKHNSHALALYNPIEHRALVTRFGLDTRVNSQIYRAFARLLLGYPDAALVDAEQALAYARDIGQATTLMMALTFSSGLQNFLRNPDKSKTLSEELIALTEEKGAVYWKSSGLMQQGSAALLMGDPANAVQVLTVGLNLYRSTGANSFKSQFFVDLARANAQIGKLEDAWWNLQEARNALVAGERHAEAEIHRAAGEIELMSSNPDISTAEAYFNQALAVARKQEAKFFELRAASSMARLWRDRGKRDEAHDLLAPIYGWFTEGFDTLDLKEAKGLLDALAA